MTRLLVLSLAMNVSLATARAVPPDEAGPPPTAENVSYGPHPRQVLDFWRVESVARTPVVVMIHGGGWVTGDKTEYRQSAAEYLKAGVAVAAVNYRLIPLDRRADSDPPVQAPLADAARAVQFVRSKAGDWNLDKGRVGATGESAGGCSSLWLAFHDDMKDPGSPDPVARESTRLSCVAVLGAQTTLDPKVTREWVPNARYGGHAFGVSALDNRDGFFQRFYEQREGFLPEIAEYSPLTHVTRGDPPVFLEYPAQKKPPVKGEAQDDPTHSALLGLMLMEKLKAEEVEGIIVYPGHPHERYKTSADFLIDRLKPGP